jgi:hypothetical protein
LALNKQLITLPIDNGLDTKIDEKQSALGFLRRADNVVYETLKLLRKRNGYDLVSSQLLTGGNLENVEIVTKLNNELLAIKDKGLFSFSDSLNLWTKKGTIYPVDTKSFITLKNSNSQLFISSTLVDNFLITTWESNLGGVYYSVQDINNRSFLVSNALISATGERPKVESLNNKVFIVYIDGTNLKFRNFLISTPNTLSTEFTTVNNVNSTDKILDTYVNSGRIIVGYNSNTVGAELGLFSIKVDDTFTSAINFTGESASSAITVFEDSASRIVVAWSDGNEIKYLIYSSNFSVAILLPTLVETISNVVNLTFGQINSSLYRLYYEIEQTGVANNYIKQANLSLSGTVTGVQDFYRSVGLAAKTIKFDNKILIPVVFESEQQSSYFLLDQDKIIITKFANQTAAGVLTSGRLPSTLVLDSNKIIIPNNIKSRTETDNGTFFSVPGAAYTIIDFNPEIKYQRAQLADVLHICSGILKMYDGNSVVEHGFHVYPEILNNGGTSTTGGNMSDGDYAYLALYRWTDNTGKDHRSSPTLLPLEVTLSGGTSTQTQDVEIPTLHITEKNDVIIELYRTEDAGETYYKVLEVANDKSVDYVTVQDTLSDLDLISKELLYTTGDVLENIAAPPCHIITVFNNRLAVVGDDRNRVFLSKDTLEGQPVEFTDIIYRNVSESYGDITALKAIGEKLVIFTKDAQFFIAGDGPNNLGTQDTLTLPDIISTDIGCLSPDAAILTPSGIIFQSRKGIWLLSGGMSLEYIGARVEEFNRNKITAVDIVGELNQIRFLLSEEKALVYNYNLDKWATFNNHGGLSSVVIENDYYYVREDGAIYKENRNTFSDASSTIPIKLETGWINFADAQSYLRVYSMMILMSYKSPHKLRVKVAYDYKNAWVQEELINPLNFIDPAIYGTQSPYGSGSPYGGDGGLYQIRVDFKIQKCQSIKISIEDDQDVVGEGLSISALLFKVGMKGTEGKIGVTNKFGVK